MLDEKQFVWNQFAKIHELDSLKNPINYFFYSNGIHFLCIKKSRSKYLLCGNNLKFHVLYTQSNFDIYFESEDLISCVKEFERFINLLLLPRKFESVHGNIPERDQPELFS